MAWRARPAQLISRQRLLQPHHGRAKMRLRCVPVALDGVVVAEQALHCCSLYAFAAPVDQADDGESRLAGGVQIFVNDGHDVARSEGVQIDRVFDGDVDGVVFNHCLAEKGQ